MNSWKRASKVHPQASTRLLVRNFVIELAIYGGLVTLYYALALRLLASPLRSLFEQNLLAYAVVALVLIVAQGMLLESLTSYLIERLGLQRFE